MFGVEVLDWWVEYFPTFFLSLQNDQNTAESLKALKKYILVDDADAKDQIDAIRLSSKLGAFGDLEFLKRFTDSGAEELELLGLHADAGLEEVLTDLIRITCEQFNVSEEQLCGSTRDAKVVKARAVLALVALRSNMATLSSLAERLSRNHSSLSRLRSKALTDSWLSRAADELYSRLVASSASRA